MGRKGKKISSPELTQDLKVNGNPARGGLEGAPSHQQGSGLSSLSPRSSLYKLLQCRSCRVGISTKTLPLTRGWTLLEEESALNFTSPARSPRSPGRAASPADALSLPLTPSPASAANIRLFAGK